MFSAAKIRGVFAESELKAKIRLRFAGLTSNECLVVSPEFDMTRLWPEHSVNILSLVLLFYFYIYFFC